MLGPMASLLFFVPLWGPQVTLSRIAGNTATEARSYTIADGMILVTMLAIATSLASLMRDELPMASFLFVVLMTTLLALLLWYKCLKFMAQNGVKGNWQRIVMQVFVYPSSVLSIAYAVILAMMFLSGLADSFDKPVPATYLFVLLGALLLSIGWIYLTRLTYRKILLSESGAVAG